MINRWNLSLLTLFFSLTTYAAYPEVPPLPPASVVSINNTIYIGGDFGWGRENISDGRSVEPITGTNPLTAGNIVTLNRRSLQGAAGRLNVGFNFNSYVALELGGDLWEEGKYRWNAYDPDGVPITDIEATRFHGVQSNYDADLLLKLTAPLPYGFMFFGKVGPAYVWSHGDPNEALGTVAPIIADAAHYNSHAIRPEAAGGVGYDIDQYWSIHAQYLFLWGKGSSPLKSGYVPSLQQLTIGVQYNFV
jgi:hypothetical protein